MGTNERLTENAASVWFWRLCYLMPIVLTPLYVQFEKGVAVTLERTRPEWILLPLPCVTLKQDMEIWKGVPVLCIALFVLSLFLPKLADARAIAAWFSGLFLFIAWQLFWAYMVIAVFLR